MIAIFLAPLYILLNAYLLYRIHRWLGVCHTFFQKKWVQITGTAVYTFSATAILTGFLLPSGQIQRFLKLMGNYWLGILLYLILVIAGADIIRLLLIQNKRIAPKIRNKRTFRIVGTVCAVIVATVSLYGMQNARSIHVTPYEVTIPKQAGNLKELNIMLIADLHLGYNIGCGQMEQMVEKINSQKPDVVVIAGDIFDNEYEALDSPAELSAILSGIQSKYGVYAVYGNHDIQEKILAGFTFSWNQKKESDPRMDELLEDAGIQLLRDEFVLVDNSFYLYGRPDSARPGRNIQERKTPEEIIKSMDVSKPVIIIDHQPRELLELAKAGADMDLSGHTHDGQMFPGNLTIGLLWDNPYGYEQKGSMHSIVTSGVGVFGANMRVGTIAEICPIKVTFQAP